MVDLLCVPIRQLPCVLQYDRLVALLFTEHDPGFVPGRTQKLKLVDQVNRDDGHQKVLRMLRVSKLRTSPWQVGGQCTRPKASSIGL